MVTDRTFTSEKWSNKTMFIIAAIASAVGIGNIWRYPYLVSQNGGGSFIIPYLFAVILVGAPLMFLEFFAGSKIKKTPLLIFRQISKKYAFLGYVPIILNFLIVSYYVVVTGWTLSYLISSFSDEIITFSDYSATNFSIYSTLAVIAIIFIVMRFKITKGLEKLNKCCVPIFVISLILLFIGSIYTYGYDMALDFYTQINPDYLFNLNTWILAFSQAFFSLGVGICVMLTYGSYVKGKLNIFGSTAIVSIIDTSIALFAGFMVVTLALGNNLPLSGGPSLAFDTLPLAFHSIPFSEFALPIFFLLLFSAALTSALSMMEVPITLFEDRFSFDRKKSVLILTILLIIISFPSALSYSGNGFEIFGAPFLDFMDETAVSYIFPFAILITVVFLAWGHKNLENEIQTIMGKASSKLFLILIKYLIPAFLILLIFLSFSKVF
ncbi:MAG: sodium-dependent transporter [Candidatus Micrarchaeia archaeon]